LPEQGVEPALHKGGKVGVRPGKVHPFRGEDRYAKALPQLSGRVGAPGSRSRRGGRICGRGLKAPRAPGGTLCEVFLAFI
jgi:hypothetical protein